MIRRGRGLFLEIFDDRGAAMGLKMIALYAVLIAANLLAWAWAFASFQGYPLLLGTAVLAYGFGLRHESVPGENL